MMDRRAFIAGAALGLAPAPPLAAQAQQTGKAYRVGIIGTGVPVSEMAGPEPASPSHRAFVQALRALGYVEGQNLILERRSAEGPVERFGDIVADLVRLKVDVIVCGTTPMTRAAKRVTTTVPIVMAVGSDPVAEGLVQSLARPGGNITGLTFQVGPEVDAKRLELLKAMLPSVSRVAYLGSTEFNEWDTPSGQSVRTAAQALGMTLVRAEITAHEYTEAFKLIGRTRAEALFVARSPPAYPDRALVVDFATRTRLPSSFVWREAVERGGLMSYGVNAPDIFRRAAGYVDKILKGAKPADLPIEQPTKFELVINLKTAKALGLSVPQTLLLRADEVIE